MSPRGEEEEAGATRSCYGGGKITSGQHVYEATMEIARKERTVGKVSDMD